MTCEPLEKEEIFWVTDGISQDRFDAMWNYCKGNWDGKIVELEHEGINKDGIPKNPKFISLIDNS